MKIQRKDIQFAIHNASLNGILDVPVDAKGIVLFAHGSGSSRFSVRNQQVASVLNEVNIATLLFDLLTPEEEKVDEFTREHRFNIALLASRLIAATDWALQQPDLKTLALGYFGASTGAGAALAAAAEKRTIVKAVVSRGGRPDLAGDALHTVPAPTLLIIGGNDPVVIDLNQTAFDQLTCEKRMVIVPGATHLFEEPGTLDKVADLAKAWFLKYL